MRRRRSGPEDLLVFREGGSWQDVRSADVNAYLQEKIGEEFSAKDFRTWHGTVLAAVELAAEGAPASKSGAERAIRAAVRRVAEQLGNTPAVCRSSYIDPASSIASARARRSSSPISPYRGNRPPPAHPNRAPGPRPGRVRTTASYTVGMTHKVGTKGQVVIPKSIRDQIGIKPGDEVVFEPDGQDVRVRRVADDPEARRQRIRTLRGVFANLPGFSTDALEADRREEREREERRDKEREARRSH